MIASTVLAWVGPRGLVVGFLLPVAIVALVAYGVFEPLVELGDTVMPGTPAARIHMPETPWLPPVEITFKAAGIVMCKRIPARTKRGDCLFHLASDLSV